MERPEWMADGACRGLDPDIFYPERGDDAAEAKKVCRRCTVSEECLTYALETVEPHGIWGGTSAKERERMRRGRGRARRQCRWCNTTFTPLHGSQFYCQPTHAAAASSARKLSARVG